jgi:MinD superfamily P-loop ATPase
MAGLKIAVASGKGGTGKTTVATALAQALGRGLAEAQFIDCDVEEPDAALFLKPEITDTAEIRIDVPVIDGAACDGCGKCRDACRFNSITIDAGRAEVHEMICSGCGRCSMVCPAGAISTRSRRIGVVEIGSREDITFYRGVLDIGWGLSTPVIRDLKTRARGDLVTVLDCGPGVSSSVAASLKDCDCCVLVMEPTPGGLFDLGLMLGVARTMEVPAAIVVNKYCSWSPRVDDFTGQWNAPILMRIPFEREIAYALSRGMTLIEADPAWGEKFWALYEDLGRLVWSDQSK